MSDKINFLPEDYLERKAQHRTNVICLSLFCLVMAGVAGAFVMTEKRQAVIDEQVRKVNNDMLQASESLKQLETLEAKKKLMMQKANISASLMESVPRSLLIATVTNDLPAGVSLLNYNLVSKEDQPDRRASSRQSRNKKKTNDVKKEAEDEVEPVKKISTSVELTGVAPSDIQVAELIENLNRFPLLKQVNLMFSEEHEDSGEMLRKFKLMVMLNPDARATESEVDMARRTHVSGM